MSTLFTPPHSPIRVSPARQETPSLSALARAARHGKGLTASCDSSEASAVSTDDMRHWSQSASGCQPGRGLGRTAPQPMGPLPPEVNSAIDFLRETHLELERENAALRQESAAVLERLQRLRQEVPGRPEAAPRAHVSGGPLRKSDFLAASASFGSPVSMAPSSLGASTSSSRGTEGVRPRIPYARRGYYQRPVEGRCVSPAERSSREEPPMNASRSRPWRG
mmetsp:Transcript_136195/g.307918  ORF Transcript_136195/g.307918 Transcript_136195/m.307918 type:complete len:222 (-) Transcript_136195:128-793(-)